MPRSRALFALLLAVTWCTAAWHVDLEAVGMLFEHHHHAHDHATPHQHGPVSTYDAHDDVVARALVKDQLRLSPSSLLWLALLVPVAGLIVARRRESPERRGRRRRRETDPPFAGTWHFLQRCAPESVAPPAAA